MKKYPFLLTLLLPAFILISLSLQGCGGNGDDSTAEQEQDMDPYLEQFQERLTPFEQEHGIGPITERIEISNEIDQEMVMRGREIFEMKCIDCHSLEQDEVGPSLGDVVNRRSPEFIMNFMLNPGENVLNHPVGLDLLAEHNVEMPYRDVSEDEARAVYEFLRDYYASQ
ncbi:MAG: cytochrome c [Balneolaceae bacterium]|nr:cytochrome c [Balneolaceae bacterium]